MLDFPDDENGDVLRRMAASGDDLSKPRQIDFTVAVPGESEAATLAERYRRQGYDVSFKRSDVVPDLPWDVVVRKFMLPDHSAITSFELELEDAATPFGGRNDGWGCFERPAIDH
jgi:Regulator of ribonuclease activity B